MQCDLTSKPVCLEFKRVSKSYGGTRLDIVRSKLDKLKNFQFFEKTKPPAPFYALKDVSFQIREGEKVGLIGHNGAGKSTTLKLVQGVTIPTSGEIVSGDYKIGGLIELGAGFDAELTAIENIYLGTALMGYSAKDTDKIVEEIFQISELSNFRYLPLKKFSSGMKVKLGFAVAMMSQPDIVLLDEVLSVGDMRFRKKSIAMVEQYLKNKTILFVSHGMGQIREVCDRVIILNKGEKFFDGDIDEGISAYEELMGATEVGEKRKIIPGAVQRGADLTPKIEATKISLIGHKGDSKKYELKDPSKILLKIDFKAKNESIKKADLHVSFTKVSATNINSLLDQEQLTLDDHELESSSKLISMDISNLYSGSYQIDAWLEIPKQSKQVRRVVRQLTFEVHRGENQTNKLVSLGIRKEEVNSM